MRIVYWLLAIEVSRSSCIAKRRSIAFPAIGTGIYGFPKQRTAEIAVSEARAYRGDLGTLLFVCSDAETADIYRELLRSTLN